MARGLRKRVRRVHHGDIASTHATRRRYLATSPFNVPEVETPPQEPFTVGERVSHDKHGMGSVVAVEGETSILLDCGKGPFRVAVTSPSLSRL